MVDGFALERALAWEVTVAGSGLPSERVVVVDTADATVRRSYDRVHSADSGTGHPGRNGDRRRRPIGDRHRALDGPAPSGTHRARRCLRRRRQRHHAGRRGRPVPTERCPITGYIVRVSPGTARNVAASARSLRLAGLDIRKAYTIGVRATSANGDSPGKTLTLTPTSLPLTVSPTTLTHGGPVTLSGRALRGGAGPIAGAVVTLDQRPAGRST